MLKISLDEAYVFDLLSITQVKLEKSNSEKKVKLKKSFDQLSNEIVEQIGYELFNKIIRSEEYYYLKKANEIVFDLVDRANESEISKITADANYERYLKKITLQNKFFKNELIEVKL